MKNKKKIIIIGLILLVIVGLLVLLTLSNNKKIEEETLKKECIPFVGGSFILKINKNNNESIEEKTVCIACSPDSYEKIENPTYKGYKFLGWYYDSEFKEKVEINTTLDIEPIEEKDKDGCITGYKTIEIYAKWEKE